MCGRYVSAKDAHGIVEFFDVELVGETLPDASWNVAPTDPIMVVIDTVPKDSTTAEPVRRLETARWGLVPPWAKDPSAGARMFNARIEEAAEKSSFRTAVKKRRAAIPASGYYEWRTSADGTKTPFYIHPGDDTPIAFAGLYEWWRNPAAADDDPARWLLSATILTQDSAGPLAEIHDRMPVMLDRDAVDHWLDPSVEGDVDLLEDIASAGLDVTDELTLYPVGREVGNVRNNSVDLLRPAPDSSAR